ncbi:recombinase family protein [Ruminococcus flavefaciens]|uniref:recombinase family protein n=1 Tax=Ruminococcus flavefaciens TaxID=1265 RepID=UPI0026EE934B|nr:recombinase family protein [Ruminococcus flavefaciens]
MRGIKFPFGYKFENGEVHIVEEEAEIVRRIFEDRINGVTSPKIGAALYVEEIPYFSDSLVKAEGKVMTILRNERYFGADGLPPVITEETYQQARSKMRKKRDDKAAEEHRLIKKMSFCEICGTHMGHNYSGSGVPRWCCATKGCVNRVPVITEDMYKNAISTVLNSVVKNPKVLNVKATLTEYEPNESIKAHENKITEMLERKPVDAEKVTAEIFALATEQYDCCTFDMIPYITAELKVTAKRSEPSDTVNTELLQQIADRIVVGADKKISVIFKNGRKITYKESDTDEP